MAQSQQEETGDERTDRSDSPFCLGVKYSLYSDYVWRGINLSEYEGEGREKPNHQLELTLDVDLGLLFGQDKESCGIFHVEGWFEWFAAQKKLDPDRGGQNLQEVDYKLSWEYEVEAIDTTVSLGYIFYVFPNATDINTQEWWLKLKYDDGRMWKGLLPKLKDGFLNPSITVYHDVDTSSGSAVWMEFELSHEFKPGPNLTIKPSWTLGVDHNMYHHIGGDAHGDTTRIANVLWGLELTYNMSEVRHSPMTVSGFVYFSDALGSAEDSGFIQDEFFGGMSVGWSFGSCD